MPAHLVLPTDRRPDAHQQRALAALPGWDRERVLQAWALPGLPRVSASGDAESMRAAAAGLAQVGLDCRVLSEDQLAQVGARRFVARSLRFAAAGQIAFLNQSGLAMRLMPTEICLAVVGTLKVISQALDLQQYSRESQPTTRVERQLPFVLLYTGSGESISLMAGQTRFDILGEAIDRDPERNVMAFLQLLQERNPSLMTHSALREPVVVEALGAEGVEAAFAVADLVAVMSMGLPLAAEPPASQLVLPSALRLKELPVERPFPLARVSAAAAGLGVAAGLVVRALLVPGAALSLALGLALMAAGLGLWLWHRQPLSSGAVGATG